MRLAHKGLRRTAESVSSKKSGSCVDTILDALTVALVAHGRGTQSHNEHRHAPDPTSTDRSALSPSSEVRLLGGVGGTPPPAAGACSSASLVAFFTAVLYELVRR